MRNALAIIAAIISAVGTLPYIVDTIKGKTHPNIVSWTTWTLLNAITALAAWTGDAKQTAILAGADAFVTLVVVVAGLHFGRWRYTVFDIVCQTLAFTGIVLWRLTHQPAAAVALNIVSDATGALPTLRHALSAPQEETWVAYAGGAVSGIITAAAAAHLNFISLAYPVYIAVACTILMTTIVSGRRSLSRAAA